MSPIYFITHHSPYSFGITPPAPHQKVILSFSAIALFAGVRLTTAAIFVHKLIPKFATRSNKRKKTSFSLSNSLFIIVGWKLTEWINIWAIIVEQHILRGGRNWGQNECRISFTCPRITHQAHVFWGQNHENLVYPGKELRSPRHSATTSGHILVVYSIWSRRYATTTNIHCAYFTCASLSDSYTLLKSVSIVVGFKPRKIVLSLRNS